MLHQEPAVATERANRQEMELMERSELTHQEGVLRVECPVCDALIMARDEEDLSDDLRDHMADHHDIRPRRLAWISRKM